VIHVVTAVINRGRRINMTTSTTENETTHLAVAAMPEATKKANPAPRKPHVAHTKAQSGKKAAKAKKPAKGAKAAKHAAKPESATRQGSKTGKVIDLLKRPEGATAKDLMKATGWQSHSVRGFLSGTLGKKMGLTVISTKGTDGERSYSIKA
jgi:hypothetical protein